MSFMTPAVGRPLTLTRGRSGRRDPAGLAAGAGILDHDAHAVAAVIVPRRAQDPDARVVHCHDGINAFRHAQGQHADAAGSGDRIAVQRDDLELVAGECELDVLRGARVQDAEHDALAAPDAHGLAVTERLPVDREGAVTDLEAVRPRIPRWRLHRAARPDIVWLLHLLRPEEGLPLVRRQEDLAVVAPRLVRGLDEDEAELARVHPAMQVGPGERMRVHPARAGRPGREDVATCPVGRHGRCALLGGPIDLRRHELAVPVHQLGRIRLVDQLDNDRAPLAQPYDRRWNTPVVAD
ncbi:MAG TPA: hypothetical protein VF192_12180, partial [Longimicrobiales bacterium]